MRRVIFLVFLFFSFISLSQQDSLVKKENFYLNSELFVGVLAPPNKNFVKHGLQTQVFLNLNWEHSANKNEWGYRIPKTRTGFGFGYTNFGNRDNLGYALTALPFIEFSILGKEHLTMKVGMGASYFNKVYDSLYNPNNQGISTQIALSFRAFLYYELPARSKLKWRLGMGYAHHSNGHTRLPNQGLNSFLIGLSTDLNYPTEKNVTRTLAYKNEANKHYYFSLRAGYGEHVLSKAYNDRKGVSTFSAEYGTIINNTFKLGLGFYHRFYKHYYDYINTNESLVQDGEEFDYFKNKPRWSATNLGVFATAEILMSHIAIEAQLGFNIHKPAYAIDWRINQGWSYVPRIIPENAVLGKFNTKYKFKKLINTRLGLKYYLNNTSRAPKHNMYIGFHINANLGQADLADFSFGYVRRLGE